MKRVTATFISKSKSTPKVLRVTLFRLPAFNTLGCNMEIKETVIRKARKLFPNMSGACALLTHQACLAGSRPRSGLTLFLAVTHRKAFLKKTFLVSAFVHGGLFDGE